MEREAFDADDPVNALAEKYRRGVIELGQLLLDDPSARALDADGELSATIGGLLTGTLAVLIAGVRDEAHAELRSKIIEMLPYYFDSARSCGGLEPLGSGRPEIDARSYEVQHRLFAVLGGVPLHEAFTSLGAFIASELTTSCASEAEAGKVVAALTRQINRAIGRHWSDAEFAEARERRLAAAREALN